MERLPEHTAESGAQTSPSSTRQHASHLDDRFGGPERDLYPRERFHAVLNGEMTPDEYVSDVQAFIDARRALDRPATPATEN
jgi:hypothetical protein